LWDSSISGTFNFVSDQLIERVNKGSYDQPFSGVGMEFDPLGIQPARPAVTLHETGYLEANVRWNFPGVFSPFWRFYQNSSRGHCVLFGERMVELLPGVIMLIPPHCLFHCLGGNPVPSFWLAFSYSRRLHGDVVPPVVLKARDTDLCLIRDLKNLVASNPYLKPDEAVYHNSIALLHSTLSRPELRWQPAVPENLAKAIDHVGARIGEKFSTRELAGLAATSVSGFNRLFRAHFGTSPGRYVAEMRVREAARLLLESKETIEKIAEATGFPNRAYFTRVFKRITAEAPAGFRRTHRRPGSPVY
jgi:AraC-like DNA-binding protein